MTAYFIYYILGIILIPAIILSIYAEIKVKSTFSEYQKTLSKSGSTAYQVARRLLDYKGLQDVNVVEISGNLTDNFNPKNKTISLSSDVYNSTSISAIAVACHEVGHAYQYKDNYFPIKIRNTIIPICNISSKLLLPLVIIGLIFDFLLFMPIFGNIILISGVTIFGLSTLFNFITLPIEYNASNRAYDMIIKSGELDQEELNGAKKVLSSAALTYLAAFVYSLLNLLRFVLTILAITGSKD